MKKLSIVCFTESGARLCTRLIKELSVEGDQCEGYAPQKLWQSKEAGAGLIPMLPSLGEWTKEQFTKKDGIIFIGAAGIAVRAIAPFLISKAKDPAVVVIDDKGRFSISLLSGHLGGANELAKRVADIAGGQAVITTATDIHGSFAVDLFAQKQGLVISQLKKVKEVSSAVLRGEAVGFYSDFPLEGDLPPELLTKEPCKVNLWITIKNKPEDGTLRNYLKLVPRLLVLGIGCRRGVPAETIAQAVNRVFDQWNLSLEGLVACASIDLKKEEPGICEYGAGKGIEFYTFPARTLAETEGEFSASSFVKQVTGVDNVCERAALTCAKKLGGGKLLIKKQASDGVTVAVAVLDWKVKL